MGEDAKDCTFSVGTETGADEMTTTVQSLLTVMLRHLQEDAALLSGLWDQTELIGYISDADREFITLSGAVMQVNNVLATTGQSVYAEPADCIDTERLAWNGKKLYPQTLGELDSQNQNWKADSGTPMRYHRDQLPPKQFETWKKPATSGIGYTTTGNYGVLRHVSGTLTYTTTGTYGTLRSARGARNYYVGYTPYAHTVQGPYGTLRQAVTGATNFLVFYDELPPAVTIVDQLLTTPDSFVRYVMYRALERAWLKEGDGQDPDRAKYCNIRFTRGVALARRLAYGDEERNG
jgi:hypothetical protein